MVEPDVGRRDIYLWLLYVYVYMNAPYITNIDATSQ